jgi:hypothetical protein
MDEPLLRGIILRECLLIGSIILFLSFLQTKYGYGFLAVEW